MMNNKIELPSALWITYKLFNETIVEESTLLEVTYDNLGLKKCYYKNSSGSLCAWVRGYLSDTKLFETEEQAIQSVEDGPYSVMYIKNKD